MVAQRTIESGIFADSLLETSWAQRSRRSWTTLTSFGIESVALVLLLLLPLWKTVGLPSAHTLSTPLSVVRPAPDVSAAARPRGGPVAPNAANLAIHTMTQPSYIPTHTDQSIEDPVAPAPFGNGVSSSDQGPGLPSGLLSGGDGVMPVPALAPLPATRTFRTSSMVEGNLIRRVQPAYPPLARNARIQGPVVLAAIISKSGIIENLRVISGHPMLVKAAIDAVSGWRYRPYILNSEPVEVETQITVNFTLGGS